MNIFAYLTYYKIVSCKLDTMKIQDWTRNHTATPTLVRCSTTELLRPTSMKCSNPNPQPLKKYEEI